MGGRCSIVKAVTLIVIGVLLVVATQPSRAEIRGDGVKIRPLYIPSGTNAFLPFVIQKLALDGKYGFELQAVPKATTQAGITANQAGAAELGTFGWNDILRMRNAGIKVVGVAPFLHWGADFLVAAVNSPVQTLGDIKGRKFGTSLNYIIERKLARKVYNFDLEKDATIIEARPACSAAWRSRVSWMSPRCSTRRRR